MGRKEVWSDQEILDLIKSEGTAERAMIKMKELRGSAVSWTRIKGVYQLASLNVTQVHDPLLKKVVDICQSIMDGHYSAPARKLAQRILEELK